VVDVDAEPLGQVQNYARSDRISRADNGRLTGMIIGGGQNFTVRERLADEGDGAAAPENDPEDEPDERSLGRFTNAPPRSLPFFLALSSRLSF
jgi:hypothetical protein